MKSKIFSDILKSGIGSVDEVTELEALRTIKKAVAWYFSITQKEALEMIDRAISDSEEEMLKNIVFVYTVRSIRRNIYIAREV